MRFAAAVVATLLSLTCSSRAQQHVVTDKPQIRVEAILHFHSESCGVADLANESIQIGICTQLSITNKSRSPITAWAALAYTYHKAEPLPDLTGGGMMDYLTSGLGLSPKVQVIAPQDTRRTIMPDCDGVVLKAVIFADGSALGDPQWVKAIVERRGRVYSDASRALNALAAAERGDVPIRALVAQLRSLARKENEEQIGPARTGSPVSVIAPPAVFGNIEFNLRNVENKPTVAQRQAIDFWRRGMRNMVLRLQSSQPPIGLRDRLTAGGLKRCR